MFCRMEEIHPVSRPKMRAAYFAYLQNNPGSRKAVYECLRHMHKQDGKDGKDDGEDAGDNAGNISARSSRSNKSKSSEKSSAKA